MATVINISDVRRRFSIAGGPGARAREIVLEPGQKADGVPDSLVNPVKGAARRPLPSIVHQLTNGHVVPLDSDKARVSRAASTKPGVKPPADDDGDIPEVTGN